MKRVREPRRLSHAEGFTLIELILVIVLIGAIVTFAATRILGGGDRAKVNLAKAQLQTLSDKLDQYHTDTGQWPASLSDLVKPTPLPTGWLGPYAKPIELNDPWGHPFQYRVPGQGRAFDLMSYGRDGQSGGTSVDADLMAD